MLGASDTTRSGRSGIATDRASISGTTAAAATPSAADGIPDATQRKKRERVVVRAIVDLKPVE